MILGQSFPHIALFIARQAQLQEPGFSCANCAHTGWCDQPPGQMCEERLLQMRPADQERYCAQIARATC